MLVVLILLMFFLVLMLEATGNTGFLVPIFIAPIFFVGIILYMATIDCPNCGKNVLNENPYGGFFFLKCKICGYKLV